MKAINLDKESSWVEIGAHLYAASESTYSLPVYTNSFSAYLLRVAEKTQRKEAMVWRIFAAYKYYKHLKAIHFADLPVEPSNKLSVDNLDILAKLERAMPEADFLEVAQKVINSDISRSQLREVWAQYKDVLEGETARGRGKTAPKANFEEQKQATHAFEAKLFMQLAESKELFGDVKLIKQLRLQTGQPVDYTLIASNEGLKIHAVEHVGFEFPDYADIYAGLRPFYDYLWLIVTEKNEQCKGLPDDVGILLSTYSKLTVVRSAKLNVTTETAETQFLRTLLQSSAFG